MERGSILKSPKFLLLWKPLVAIALFAVIGVSIFSSAPQKVFHQYNGRIEKQLNARIVQVGTVWLSVNVAGTVLSVFASGGIVNTLDRISNLCFWALQGLFLQRVMVEISVWLLLKLIVPGCAVLGIIALICGKNRAEQIRRRIMGIVVIALGLCVAVPLSVEASNLVEVYILEGRMERIANEIQGASDKMEAEAEEVADEENGEGEEDRKGIAGLWDSVTGSVRNIAGTVREKVAGFFQGMGENFKKRAEELMRRAIEYLALFAVTSVIIPIGTLFLVKYLVTSGLKLIGFSLPQKSVEQVKPARAAISRDNAGQGIGN